MKTKQFVAAKFDVSFSCGESNAGIYTVNTYSDSAWKDKLTSFNGQTITYDAIGNPTSYRGATATWFGRQMQSYAKGSDSISYKYDGNGLRTSKTVNGVEHDYCYVNDVLTYEKVGSDYELYYRYDNDGKLAMVVRYNFSNNKKYYYNVVTNTQGDVIKLLGGGGTVAAEYTYDAWGNILSVKDGSGNQIMLKN